MRMHAKHYLTRGHFILWHHSVLMATAYRRRLEVHVTWSMLFRSQHPTYDLCMNPVSGTTIEGCWAGLCVWDCSFVLRRLLSARDETGCNKHDFLIFYHRNRRIRLTLQRIEINRPVSKSTSIRIRRTL